MTKILIIDDSRTSRKMLREMLETAGYTVVGEAVDGEDGYLKYKELKPDLVTLDITMPKLDGIEVLQLIRKLDAEAKVVVITAAGQKDKMVRAVKFGAADFITKPYDVEEVLKIIDQIVAESSTEGDQ